MIIGAAQYLNKISENKQEPRPKSNSGGEYIDLEFKSLKQYIQIWFRI